MSAIMTIDDSEARRHFEMLGRMGKGLAATVCRRVVDGLAFRTKDKTKETLGKFNYRNNSARNFTMRGVYVQKATNKKDPVSAVGALGDPNSGTVRGQRVSYLQRQELGGKVRQLKSRQGAFRQMLIAPDPSGNKTGMAPRLGTNAVGPDEALVRKFAKRSSRFVRRLKFRTRDRILFASALAAARQQQKKYAVTPYGVYRVGKKSARRIQVYKRGISTPRHPWLIPARDMAVREQTDIFVNAMTRTLKEAGFSA